MKITSSNQTLILADERRGSGNPNSSFGTTTASTGAALQRVTIVASQPDATVLYLRADYSPEPGGDSGAAVTYGGRARGGYAKASGADAPIASSFFRSASPGASQSIALVAQPKDLLIRRDNYGNVLTGRDTGISYYLRPEEQYAQTQRLLSESPPAQQIDVHA